MIECHDESGWILEKIFLSAEIPESTPIPAPVQISKASAFLMQSAAARIDRLEAGAELIATPFFGSFGILGKSLQEKTAANIKIIKKCPCLQAFGDTPTFRFPAEIDHRTFGLSSNFGYKYPCQSYSILTVSRTWMVEHEVRCSYTRNGPAFAVLPLHRSPCGGCRLQSFAANSFGKGGLIQWWSATCAAQLLIFVSSWKYPLSSMAPESCTLAFLLGACQTSAHHIIQLEIPNNLFWSQKLCRPLLSNAILIYSISILHILIPGLQLLWTEARTFNLGAPQWQHCLECQRNAGTFTSKMAGC